RHQRVPQRFEVLPRTASPRCVRRRADGQQRPHHGPQCDHAAGAQGGVTLSATTESIDQAYRSYLEALIDARLLSPSGVQGVYGLGGTFEDVIERFERYVTRMGADASPEVMRFPPLLSRRSYQQTDHLETF